MQSCEELPELSENPPVKFVELSGCYITVEQEAIRSGRSQATVKRWCAEKYDPANPKMQKVARVGRQWLIRIAK